MQLNRPSLNFSSALRPVLFLAASACLVALGAIPAQAAGVPSYTVSPEYGLNDHKPLTVVADPSDHSAYTISYEDSVVSKFDYASRTVTDIPLRMDAHPFAAAVDPATQTLFVACQNDKVQVIQNGSIVSTIATPDQATAIDFDPTTSTLYVGSFGGNLTIVHGATVSNIKVGMGYTSAIGIDSSSSLAYVATSTGTVYEVLGGAVISSVDISDIPDAIAIDPGTHVAYTTRIGSNVIIVIVGPTPGTIKLLGNSKGNLAIDEGSHTAYIPTDHAIEWIGEHSSGAINYPAFGDGGQVAVDQSTDTVYVAGRNRLQVIRNEAILQSLSAGSDGGLVTIDPTIHTAFVGSAGAHPALLLVQEAISPDITTTSLRAGTVGEAYSDEVVATGSPTPTFVLTAGALPDGVAIDSAGNLTGTPTAQGRFTFTVTASNGAAPDAVAEFSIDIDAAPVVTPTPTPPTTPVPTGGSGSQGGSHGATGTQPPVGSQSRLANTGVESGSMIGIGGAASVLLALGLMGLRTSGRPGRPRAHKR